MTYFDNSEKVLLAVLLKDYEAMRAEIRLYIDKFYLAVVVSLGVITYGLFSTNDETRGIAFVFIPYILSSLTGFLALVEFFVTKTSGYIKLLEARIAILFGTIPLDKGDAIDKRTKPLPPIFWESFYADIGIEREEGQQQKSLFFKWGMGLLCMAIIAMYIVVLILGGYQIRKWVCSLPSLWGGIHMPAWLLITVYVLTSIFLMIFAMYGLRNVSTKTRRLTKEANSGLKKLFELKNQ